MVRVAVQVEVEVEAPAVAYRLRRCRVQISIRGANGMHTNFIVHHIMHHGSSIVSYRNAPVPTHTSYCSDERNSIVGPPSADIPSRSQYAFNPLERKFGTRRSRDAYSPLPGAVFFGCRQGS